MSKSWRHHKKTSSLYELGKVDLPANLKEKIRPVKPIRVVKFENGREHVMRNKLRRDEENFRDLEFDPPTNQR